MAKYIVHVFMLFLICFVQIWLGMRMSSNNLLERIGCAKVKRRVPLALREREGGSKPVCPKDSEAHGPEDSWRGITVTDGLLLPGG